MAWSAAGDIIATGSNDKSIKMTRFDAETCSVTWPGLELAIHNGTVRDLAFVSRASGTPVLVSGGAGNHMLFLDIVKIQISAQHAHFTLGGQEKVLK